MIPTSKRVATPTIAHILSTTYRYQSIWNIIEWQINIQTWYKKLIYVCIFMNRNCIVMVKFPSRQCSSMQYIFSNRTAHIHEMKIQRGVTKKSSFYSYRNVKSRFIIAFYIDLAILIVGWVLHDKQPIINITSFNPWFRRFSHKYLHHISFASIVTNNWRSHSMSMWKWMRLIHTVHCIYQLHCSMKL